jgi:hypothetical protein
LYAELIGLVANRQQQWAANPGPVRHSPVIVTVSPTSPTLGVKPLITGRFSFVQLSLDVLVVVAMVVVTAVVVTSPQSNATERLSNWAMFPTSTCPPMLLRAILM